MSFGDVKSVCFPTTTFQIMKETQHLIPFFQFLACQISTIFLMTLPLIFSLDTLLEILLFIAQLAFIKYTISKNYEKLSFKRDVMVLENGQLNGFLSSYLQTTKLINFNLQTFAVRYDNIHFLLFYSFSASSEISSSEIISIHLNHCLMGSRFRWLFANSRIHSSIFKERC